MPQTIFVFDFGTDEEAAQQARHKVDAWTQAFRLGKKITLKFDRQDSVEASGAEESVQPEPENAAKKETKAKKSKPAGSKNEADKEKPKSAIRVLVKLDFSDHEKLSNQRWLDRIPTEEPFKSAKGETIRQGSAEFVETAERFDSLN